MLEITVTLINDEVVPITGHPLSFTLIEIELKGFEPGKTSKHIEAVAGEKKLF